MYNTIGMYNIRIVGGRRAIRSSVVTFREGGPWHARWKRAAKASNLTS